MDQPEYHQNAEGFGNAESFGDTNIERVSLTNSTL